LGTLISVRFSSERYNRPLPRDGAEWSNNKLVI